MRYEKLSQKLTFYKAFFSPQWKYLIHTILQCLSAKTTAWNEFSSTMASAIICLATNQKFNFSKYIFDNMVKNLDSVKFLMYPRFVRVFLDKQVGEMSTHNRTYDAPSHTKKIFGNMKRVGKGFFGRETSLFPTMMVQAQQEMGEGSAMPTVPQHTPTINQPSSSQPQKNQKPRKSKKQNTKVPQLSGSTDDAADKNVTQTSNDPLLSGEDRLKLNELMELCTKLSDRVLDLEHTKTTRALEIESLKRRVKKLEKKKRSRTPVLKRLRKVGRSARIESSEDKGLGDQEDASKQGRKITDIDQDAEVTLIDETQGRFGQDLMFDTSVFYFEEVSAGQDMAEKEVSTADPVTTTGEVVTTAGIEVSTATIIPVSAAPTTSTTTTVIAEVEITLAQTLTELKSTRSLRLSTQGISFREPSEATTTTTTAAPKPLQDKGKAKMIEPKKPLKKKDQIMHDQEVALNLQAELEEEERLARQKEEEANIALIKSWDNTQAMMDTDYQLAQQMQAKEQEQLSIEEKSKLFVQLLEARKKHFAEMRAREKRNKPPTKAQKRSTMSTYLKHMAGYKHTQLKSKSYDEIQKLFDKEMKRVNTFVDMDTELVEGSEKRAEDSTKRAGTELEQEVAKKQKIDDAKVDDDQEETRMKELMNIVPDEEEIAIDAIPLATKPPCIIDWKIIKEGKFGYYQIIRADGTSRRYSSMIQMLQSFDREDLETLRNLVKAKHGLQGRRRDMRECYGGI
ncbi:hypothetical protein Tco_1447981 [Tanacetum coccineum]